tara:strand:- start:8931 stop:9905 length:975 start_codon:yes stop_codon:yes gene_type:complete
MAIGNSFMDMINKGVKDTKKEGIMTAEQYKLGGDLNYVIEMMKNETDPDKLEELKSIIREMLGTSPYMSIRQSPDLKASNDEAVRQLEILFEMFKDQGMSDEEAEKAARERMESAAVRKAADGGIMYLAPGGSALKPSTYGSKPFEDYLKDLGFTKVDEKTGKVRGSKGAWNKFLAGKGIKIGSTQATNLLNTMLKDAGKRPYISVDMSQKGLGQSLIDEITGTQAGKPNVKNIRSSAANKIEEIRLDANDKFGKNPTKKKYEFIKDQIVKFFPKVAGTTALLNFITGRALGAVGAFMPTEMGDAELYDEEGIMKLMEEQKENK